MFCLSPKSQLTLSKFNEWNLKMMISKSGIPYSLGCHILVNHSLNYGYLGYPWSFTIHHPWSWLYVHPSDPPWRPDLGEMSLRFFDFHGGSLHPRLPLRLRKHHILHVLWGPISPTSKQSQKRGEIVSQMLRMYGLFTYIRWNMATFKGKCR